MTRGFLGKLGLIVLIQPWLSGCGSGGGADSAAAAATIPQAAGRSAIDIAQSLYDNAPRTPPGFYAEPERDPSIFYAIRHVKNTDVDPAAQTDPAQAEYELCAANWAEAEQSLAAINANGNTLARTRTNEFFEFEQSVQGESDRRDMLRFFDCGFVNRANVNLRAANGFAGVITQRPLSEAALRFLAEYTFLFTTYNNVGYLVLASEGQPEPGSLRHTLTVAELQRAAPPAACDLVTLFELRFSADLDSGEITQREVFQWEFEVARPSGRAEACP